MTVVPDLDFTRPVLYRSVFVADGCTDGMLFGEIMVNFFSDVVSCFRGLVGRNDSSDELLNRCPKSCWDAGAGGAIISCGLSARRVAVGLKMIFVPESDVVKSTKPNSVTVFCTPLEVFDGATGTWVTGSGVLTVRVRRTSSGLIVVIETASIGELEMGSNAINVSIDNDGSTGVSSSDELLGSNTGPNSVGYRPSRWGRNAWTCLKNVFVSRRYWRTYGPFIPEVVHITKRQMESKLSNIDMD